MSSLALSLITKIREVRTPYRLSIQQQRLLETRFQKLVEEIFADIEELRCCQNSNLILKEARLTSIQLQIESLVPNCLALLGEEIPVQDLEELTLRIKECQKELQRELTPILADMEEKKDELKWQKKWVAFGFPECVLTTEPDCVQFVMQSHLAESIQLFKNSTTSGSSIHDIYLDEHQQVLLRFEGTLRPWSQIKELVAYNPVRKMIVSLDDLTQFYTYISPTGLTAKSRFPGELYPVDKLDILEQEILKRHAARFWQKHAEVDPGQMKECVLQVVTTQKNCLPDSWLTAGLNGVNPQHTTLRLIDADGNLYSFGIELTDEFQLYMLQHPKHIFASGYSKVGTPDYLESRHFDERTTTSIPITSARMQRILQLAKEANKDEGMRFCISQQNCNKFGNMVMALAGITIDTRVSLAQVLVQALPSVEQMPYIGGAFWGINRLIQSVVEPVFTFLANLTPTPIKWAFVLVRTVMFYVPNKIGTVFVNSVIYCFGGAEEAQKAVDNHSSNTHTFVYFSSLLTWWGDFFDDERAYFNHSYKLYQWQMKQATTDVVKGSHLPKMHILPVNRT